MSLTLIRRRHGSETDDPWIRADSWDILAAQLRVPLPEPTPLGQWIIRWPGDLLPTEIVNTESQLPTLPDLVRAWAAHGFRWATISGTAPSPRAVRGADQVFEETNHGRASWIYGEEQPDV